MKIRNQIIIVMVSLSLAFCLSPFYNDIGKLKDNIFGARHPGSIYINDQGIPVVAYGTINGVEIGEQINPLTVANSAITSYDEFKETGSQIAKEQVITSADWIVENIHSVRYNDTYSYSTLVYQYDWPTYNMTAPWESAMANGFALQALDRAQEVTSNQKYLDAGKMILNSFFIEVKNGGVTYKNDYGWWYEEYAKPNLPTEPRVLNGMMYVLRSLDEYYRYTSDADAKLLFNNGVAALRHDISNYDNNGYSFYDMLKRDPGNKYHNIHIMLTSDLYNITGEPVLKQYHDKWAAYPLIFNIKFVPSIFAISSILFIGIGEGLFYIIKSRKRERKNVAS